MSSPVMNKTIVRYSYPANSTKYNSPQPNTCTATPPNIPALFDTACTDTSIKVSAVDAASLLPIQKSSLRLRTAKPGVTIKAIGQVPLQISTFETTAHLFQNEDLDQNLIALADITNSPNNAECRFHKNGLGIFDSTCNCGNLLAFYPKHPSAKIWSTEHMHMPQHKQASPAIRCQSSYDFVMYYHAIFGSPAASTFYRAVRNGWIVINGLSPRKIHQNWPNSMATAEGHLQQTRRGLRSTRPKNANFSKPKPSHPDFTDESETSQMSEEVHISGFPRKEAAFTDATGRYPEPSIDGFEYHLIFTYKNYIHVELMSDRSAMSYVNAYTAAVNFFAKLGHTIKNIVLDNETSKDLDAYFSKNDIDFQRVPPYQKRSNKAERGIQTWRNHWIATLGTVDPKCPTNIWSMFVAQTEICLAHLRPFEDDKSISAYEGLFGKKYDHNANPLSICGCLVSVFEPSKVRPTWSTHGVQGFYLGPDLSSYRSYRCWIPSTKSERSTGTVQFFPAPFLLPGASNEEQMIAAIDRLIALATSRNKEIIKEAVIAVTALAATIAANKPVQRTNNIDDDESPPALKDDNDDDDDGSDQRVVLPVPPVANEHDGQRVPNQALPTPAIRLDQRVLQQDKSTNPLAARRPKRAKKTKIMTLRDPTPDEKLTKTYKKLAIRIGQRFKDTETDETFVIECIKMPLKARGKGSQTPHYVYTDVRQGHMRKAQREQEFTRCAELEKALYVEWLRPKNAAYAIISEEKYDGRPLNQRADGQKFTVRGEIDGPRAGYWKLARREEFMRLFDSNTILPTHRREIPQGEIITYYNEQPKEKLPQSFVEYRVRGTYGGNRSNYTGPVSSNTAEYPVVKILMNATLSDRIHKDKNTRFATADMVDFYLGTPLDKPGYMQISADIIGNELIDLYNMNDYVVDIKGKRYIYFKVVKCLYGHPAAGRLSFVKLKEILENSDFYEHPFVECLFVHKTRNITFALIVDDMGIKYSREEDLQFLVDVITPHWKLKVDITGSRFLGMHLVWQYNRPVPRVIIFNPTVVKNALSRFVSGTILRGNKTPSPYDKPVYGQKHPQMSVFDESDPAPPETVQFVQEVTGLFGHYSRVIDYTMAEAVTTIAQSQAAPTADTMKKVSHLLNYAASHPHNCIIYEGSDMVLTAHSDASHQSVKNSRSKAGGAFYLANKGDPPTTNNGLIGVYSKIIPVVCAAASDAEYAALFQIAQLMYFYRIVCEACGYPQGPSPIYVDNDVARGIAERSVKVKRSKSIDKSFHYIRDRVELQDLVILRVDTEDNISDFFTKALPPVRHQHLATRINQRTPKTLLSDTN